MYLCLKGSSRSKEKYRQRLHNLSDRWRPKCFMPYAQPHAQYSGKQQRWKLLACLHLFTDSFRRLILPHQFFHKLIFKCEDFLFTALLCHITRSKERSLAVWFIHKHALIYCRSDAEKWLTFLLTDIFNTFLLKQHMSGFTFLILMDCSFILSICWEWCV